MRTLTETKACVVRKPFLGVIADDYTGATDIASMLVRGGVATIQTIGIPSQSLCDSMKADAVVIALKSRALPAADAVAQSLAALSCLRNLGVRQIYFKYCSTFDSTPAGNIGQVGDALCAALEVSTLIHIPALPVNGRSVYQGHLFVGTTLLHQSGMENHPLNPMTDANLVRWLGRQTRRTVGLIGTSVITKGRADIDTEIAAFTTGGGGHLIGDTVQDSDLELWAQVLQSAPLVAGSSGLATPLARRYMAAHQMPAEMAERKAKIPPQTVRNGHTLILSGSCSSATLAQIETFRTTGAHCIQLDPLRLSAEPAILDEVLESTVTGLKNAPVLVYASDSLNKVQAAQNALGAVAASKLVEQAFVTLAQAAARLPQTGQLIVAGGETSGAVVAALGIAALRIGPEIAPGVPWTEALDAQGALVLSLALKSGNFGGDGFFSQAIELAGRA